MQRPESSIAITRATARPAGAAREVDPVTAEIIRSSLNSAANQMKQALVRTAYTPVIYETLDFAAAIYDRQCRLLAQARSLPIFMGTLNFCVQAAIDAQEEPLEPGDILLYNWPYGTGSHAQDAALVMPVFLADGTLMGYAAIKAHWMDVGATDFYATNTTDVYQEGTFFPGVKLFRRGKPVAEMFRLITQNSRMPNAVKGDVHAQATGVMVGAQELRRVIEAYGRETFEAAVERIFDHGEAVVRSWLEKLPDGRYVSSGCMDNDGVSDDPIAFEVAVEIKGSGVCVDLSNAPGHTAGPVNCPLPTTVSAARVAIAMLAGSSEGVNEGYFRPLEIVTRRGTLFHAEPPAPCFLYAWPAMQAMEVIYRAIANVHPEAVPASSGGDISGVMIYGIHAKSGEPWATGSPLPCGQGGHMRADGATLMHIAESATRFPPVEVSEARFPLLFERLELEPDSCGPGKHRGGLALRVDIRCMQDSRAITVLEHTKSAPWGAAGGGEGESNSAVLRYPDGSARNLSKCTGLPLPAGSVISVHTGGGGGWGNPAERATAAVRADIDNGYVTERHARMHYPLALLSLSSKGSRG